MEISSDFKDLLRALSEAEADAPRATADFDVWVGASETNAPKVYRALADFGAPLENLTVAELATPDVVFMIGVPPFRIDVLTTIDGVEFADAWNRRVEGTFDGIRVWFISRNDLITNKESVARDKDLLDVRRLRKVE